MTATLDAPPRRRHRTLLLAGLLLAAAVGSFAGWQWRRYLALEAQLWDAVAEVERTDPHWRLEDIEADRARVPDAENSAPLILRIRTVTPRPVLDPDAAEARRLLLEGNLSPAVRLTDEQYRTALDALEEVEPSVRLYLRLARFPRGRHAITYAPDGFSTLLSHVDAINFDHWRIGQFLTLVSAHERDGATALAACTATLNLGSSLGDEPVLVSQLHRFRHCMNAVRSLERSLGQMELPADGLTAFQVRMAEEAEFPSWAIALRGERALLHQMLTAIRERRARRSQIQQMIDRSTLTSGPFEAPRTWLRDYFTADVRADDAWLLRTLTALLADADRPLHEQALLVQEQSANLAVAPPFARQTWQWIGFAKRFRLFQLGQARMRCTAVALALERYRLARGAWPAALADLPPELLPSVSLDPFDGKPLRYRRLADGVVVYSVGPDGADDGGDLSDHYEPEQGKDVGFRLWDVAKRRQPPPTAEPPRANP
jgi:hypothetical protein